MSWILQCLKRRKRWMALTLLLGVLTALFGIALMFTSGFLISKSALRPENILMVYVPVVGVRTFGIGRAALRYVERLAGHDTVLRMLSHMRVLLYRLLEPQAAFLRTRFSIGDLLGTLSGDVERLQDIFIRTVFPAFGALLLYAVTIIFLGYFDVPFALLLGGYMLLLLVVLPSISLCLTSRIRKQQQRSRNALYAKLTDGVMGLADWMISGRSRQFALLYEQDERESDRLERKLSNWSILCSWLMQVAGAGITLLLVSWAGVQAGNEQLPVTLIAAFVLAGMTLTEAFLPLPEAVDRISGYTESLRRLTTISQQQSEAPQVSKAAKSGIETADGVSVNLQRVSYQYDQESGAALCDVSFHFPAGSRTMILGRSGGGKSTLLKLITGSLHPAQGEVTLNGYSVASLGEYVIEIVGVLNQKPHIFDATVADNLRLGRPDASDEEIQHVAAKVGLAVLIESLPLGYHTPMLEMGSRFSGGERQRIALARILLQASPVVLLDEPTAGLDPRTEAELLKTILLTLQGRTLIWVTHHLHSAEQMDNIIFMKDGQVEMEGTHLQLLAHRAQYRRLYELERPVGILKWLHER